MPVDAEGAAVDLRGSQLDQLEERGFKAARVHVVPQVPHHLRGARRRLVIVDT
jgi:hypothetical protein